MARPRTTANAVVIEETVATGGHAYDKELGASSPAMKPPLRPLSFGQHTPIKGRDSMSAEEARPFTTSSHETRAQTLRGRAVSNAAQRALTRFDLERGRDASLPKKLKHPEAFLP